MAKGMNKPKKEAKKPKKDKKAADAGANPLTARIVAAQEKARGDKG